MQYPGAQVKMKVHFGKASFPLFIDLGFGDSQKAQPSRKKQILEGSKNLHDVP